MIIWGHGRKLQSLGPVGRIESCPNCGNPTTLHLGVLKKDFKLYFVPVARWNSVYFIYCDICNASAEIDRDLGRQTHEALQAGTAGLPDTKRLLGQLDSGSVQEFRPGDIVAARRNLQIGEQVVISQGQRFRIERSAGDDSGEFYLTDGDGERRRTSRGHLDFIRRGVEPREGEIWIAANDLPITDIHGVKGSRFVARGQHLEIVVASNSEGKLKVVDTEGTHYWIREMLLDPYVEDSRGVIPEPSRGTNRSLEEPAALNSTSSATTTEIYEHLRNLGKLREEGILSEEEFQTKKAELLARL